MTEFFASAWNWITRLPASVGWTTIGAIFVAFIANSVILWNSRKSLTHAKDMLKEQRTANARDAATFIAEKRQAWIDDLRNDVALYFGATRELCGSWVMFFAEQGQHYDEHEHQSNPSDLLRDYDAARSELLKACAARDSEHHQILTRIRFRLNIGEDLHRDLLSALYRARHTFDALVSSAARQEWKATRLSESIYQDLDNAAMLTSMVLKDEWQKLKREVANPEKLIADILATSASDIGALAVRTNDASSGASAVPSTRPAEIPAPPKSPTL